MYYHYYAQQQKISFSNILFSFIIAIIIIGLFYMWIKQSSDEYQKIDKMFFVNDKTKKNMIWWAPRPLADAYAPTNFWAHYYYIKYFPN